VTVALRPEKISVGREAPAGEYGVHGEHGQHGPHNRVRATVKEMSYFGSFTVFRLELPGGRMLKASAANTERHRDDALTWGDEVWAWWSDSAQVVLTQ